MKILITGGAGFIGSHLADELLERGYQVRVLDNLADSRYDTAVAHVFPPPYLDPAVEFIYGDVCDRVTVRRALEGVQVVFHLASLVGVGRSMYYIEDFTRTNSVGTAVLLEEIVARPQALERLVVASSFSLYGEGRYCDGDGRPYEGLRRNQAHILMGQWDIYDPNGRPLQPLPTPETTIPDPTSIYALSKYHQERTCLLVGQAYDLPVVVLRIFNTYGPRQPLANSYAGVLAIFASRLLNDKPPLIYEDGRQIRDFVHVRDVVYACRLALETPAAAGEIINIGSGRQFTVGEVALRLGEILGKAHLTPEISAQHRPGDVRHCFPDVSKSAYLLGYTPRVSLAEGLLELTMWLESKTAVRIAGSD